MTSNLKNALMNDMLLQGAHPFPSDMEEMLRRIHAHNPALINQLDERYFSGWQAGQDLSAGRALLQAITRYVAMQPARLPSTQGSSSAVVSQ
jgi:hypothetical protein